MVIMFVVWLICVVSMFMSSSGMICTSYKGFAVDVSGNVYVGKQSKIEVYSTDGRFIRSFSPKTSRGYSFAIYDENTILIDTADKLYWVCMEMLFQRMKKIIIEYIMRKCFCP